MDSKNSCFCELAAAFSLGILDEQDHPSVQQVMQEFPELKIELADFEAAVSAIAYSVPSDPICSQLKDQLFAEIGVAPPTILSVSQPVASPYTSRATNRAWQPHPTVAGVMIVSLFVDEAKQQTICLLRAEAGICYPQHRHAAFEEIYMLEGDLAIDGQVYYSGDYIRSSPGSSHSPYTQGGCTFFVRTSISDKFLN